MQITPSVDSAMFFFGTNVLHFSEEFYGTVLLIDGIAQVIGRLALQWLSQMSSNCLIPGSRCNLRFSDCRKDLMAGTML